MNTRDVASMVRDAVDEQFDDLRAKARRYGKRSRDKATEVKDEVAEFVEDRPLQSLLIALGVGVLLGLCWKMR